MRENFALFTSPNEIQKELLVYSDGMGFESNPGFYINRTNFNNYLVMYTMTGKLWCHQKENKILVEPGEAVLLDLHQQHQYYFEKNVPSKIAWAHLNGIPAVPLMQKIEEHCIFPMKIRSSEVYDRFITLFEISDQPSPDVFLQSEQCYGIFLLFLKTAQSDINGNIEDSRFREFKKEIWQVIEHNLHRNLSLDELARSVSLSKYHFARTFQSAFGMSPMRYVMEERIRHAKYRLLHTSDEVYRISDALGFTAPEYFSKVFKKSVGFTPLEYRNLHS